METTLIFRDGLELPDFASFVLLDDPVGVAALRSYYAAYIAIAKRHGVGIVLDTPTWRANPDWGARLGYSAEALDGVNRRGVTLLEDVRAEAGDGVAMVISGCIGPRGDGYVVADAMSGDEAQAYHSPQVSTFAGTSADLVSALTLNYADEAIGIARAATDEGSRRCSPSPSRRTGGCRAARSSGTRSPRSTLPRGPRRRTTWSTAHTRATSRTCSRRRPRARPRPASQRLDQKPRRARRSRGARPGRPGRPRRSLPRSPAAAPGPQRGRRVLRHRRAPHREDLRGVRLARRRPGLASATRP